MQYGKQTNMQPVRPVTQRERYLERERRRIAKQNRKPGEVPRWVWTLDNRSGVVEAHTRSEARARVKEYLGVGSNGRMPKEVSLAPQT